MASDAKWWRTYDVDRVQIETTDIKYREPGPMGVSQIIHAATSAESVLLSDTYRHPERPDAFMSPTSALVTTSEWEPSYIDVYCVRPPVGARWLEVI